MSAPASMPRRQSAPIDPHCVYAPADAAARLHPDLSARTMERWRRLGQGPRFVRIGKRVGYTGAALLDYLAAQERTHTHHRPEAA